MKQASEEGGSKHEFAVVRDPGDGLLVVYAVLAFALISLILFGDYLVGNHPDRIISSRYGDTRRYFRFVREFAAIELLAGNIPLWNPHSFSGTPFLAAFQTALFYPLNVIYLVLPLGKALNFDFALHLVIFGSLSFAWLRGWRLHPLAAFFGAVMIVLGATNSLRILAGQLTFLNTLAWTPLLLMSIEHLALRRSLGWTLAGIGAVTAMILAGHPPTVFMVGFATSLYVMPLIAASKRRFAFALGLLPVAILPLFFAAIQLWPGVAVGMEGVRGGGTEFEFATSFSFPPENWLTVLAPMMLGNAGIYFGRAFYWDASAFVGGVGLILAITGGLIGGAKDRSARLRWISLLLVVVTVILSMGRHTPIYRFFFEYFPGFDQFRAPSKFAFHATFFASALAAIGLDRMLGSRDDEEKKRAIRPSSIVAILLTMSVCALALWVWLFPVLEYRDGSLVGMLKDLNPENYMGETRFSKWDQTILGTLGNAIAIYGLATACLIVALRRSRAIVLLVLIGIAELLIFSWSIRGDAQLNTQYHRRLAPVFRRAGEGRVLIARRTSMIAVAERGHDLWGNESVVLDRYARFMAFTQGREVSELNNIGGNHPDRFHPLFKMLRGRALVVNDGTRQPAPSALSIYSEKLVVTDFENAFSRFYLASEHLVIDDFEELLRALNAPDFDASETLLLESEPALPSDGRANSNQREAAAASIRLLGESSDHIEISMNLAAPAFLVITDSYAEGWRVVDLAGGAQAEYSVMPANAVLRAIPLQAGDHHLRVEYSPRVYRVAIWSSGISFAAYVAALAWWFRHRRVHGSREPADGSGPDRQT